MNLGPIKSSHEPWPNQELRFSASVSLSFLVYNHLTTSSSLPPDSPQAFVLLGASVLGGRSAFVLTTGQASYDPNHPQNTGPSHELDESKLRLWNPLTGVCSSIKDVSAEMRQVDIRGGFLTFDPFVSRVFIP